MTEYWLEMAMSDSAFFHTLLGCADSYVSPKGWQRNSPITVKHLNKAISIVNQRIKRDEIPSDGTIVVVATMACVEVTKPYKDPIFVQFLNFNRKVEAPIKTGRCI